MQTTSPRMVRLRRSDPPPRQMISVKAPADSAPTVSVSPPPLVRAAPSVAISQPPALPPPVINPPAAKKVNVTEHPVAQHALMALRSKQTASPQFRQLSRQLLVLLALEATRTLPTRDDLVQTHATTHTGPVLAKPVVLLSISRLGLGLAHQVADFFPDLLVGSLSVDRNGQPAAEPRLHIANAPAFSDARVILFDPVVATGFSASQALNFVRRTGATDLTLLSFIVSFQGLTRLQTAAPDLSVWTAGIDSDWDSKRGPLPGLGNFAERLFG